MAASTVQSQPRPEFLQLLKDLASQDAQIGRALQGLAARPWNRPGDGDFWSGSPLDIEGLLGPFDRDQLSADYAQLLADASNPGSSGAAAALKLQGDYMAADERALRARYATPCRLLALAAGRRAGHGHPAGLFQNVVTNYVQDTLKAAQDA